MALQGLLSSTSLGSDSFGTIKIGENAGGSGTAPESVYLGAKAGAGNTSGAGNAVLGAYALEGAQEMQNSVAMGWKAGQFASRGEYNTLVGAQAGELAEFISFNTFLGAFAGRESKVASQNTFCGYRSGERNVTGDQNTFVGTESGQNNRSGSLNSFVGYRAGRNNALGFANTFVGSEAGADNTVGSSNTFVGLGAGAQNQGGNRNTFAGADAGRENQSGSDNVFVGIGAAPQNNTGSENTVVGAFAAPLQSGGMGNVLIGFQTAPTLETGGKNVVIGTGADVFASTTSNVVVIGGFSASASHNSIVIGNLNRNRKPSTLTIGTDILTNAANALSIGKSIAVAAGTLFSDPLSTLYASSVLTEGQTRVGLDAVDYDGSLTITDAILTQSTSPLLNSLRPSFGPTIGATYNLATFTDSNIAQHLFVSAAAAIAPETATPVQIQLVVDGAVSELSVLPTNRDRITSNVFGATEHFVNAWGTTPRPLSLEVAVFQPRPEITFSQTSLGYGNNPNQTPISQAGLAGFVLYYTTPEAYPETISFVVTRAPQYGFIQRNGGLITFGKGTDFADTFYQPYGDRLQSPDDSFELTLLSLNTGPDTSNLAGFQVGKLEITIEYVKRDASQIQTVLLAGPKREPFLLQPSFFDVPAQFLDSNATVTSFFNFTVQVNGVPYDRNTLALNTSYPPNAYAQNATLLNQLTESLRTAYLAEIVAFLAPPLNILVASAASDLADYAALLQSSIASANVSLATAAWSYLQFSRNNSEFIAPADDTALEELKVTFFDTALWSIFRELMVVQSLSGFLDRPVFSARLELTYQWLVSYGPFASVLPGLDFQNVWQQHDTIFRVYYERTPVVFPKHRDLVAGCNIIIRETDVPEDPSFAMGDTTPGVSGFLGMENTNQKLYFKTFPTVEQAPGGNIVVAPAVAPGQRIRRLAIAPSLELVESDASIRLEAAGLVAFYDPYRTEFPVRFVNTDSATGVTGYSNLTFQLPTWSVARDIHACGPPTATPTTITQGNPVVLGSNVFQILPQNVILTTIDGVFQGSNIETLPIYDPDVGVFTEFVERTNFPGEGAPFITRNFYDVAGNLYDTTFEQLAPSETGRFNEVRSRYYRQLFNETVELVAEDIQRVQESIFVNSNLENVFLATTTDTTTLRVLSSNAQASPGPDVTRLEILYSVTTVTEKVLAAVAIDQSHLFPHGPENLTLADDLVSLPFVWQEDYSVSSLPGSLRLLVGRRGNAPTTQYAPGAQVIWHPFQAISAPVLAVQPKHRVRLTTLREANLLDVFGHLSPSFPLGATHLVISSVRNGFVLADDGERLEDFVPLTDLRQFTYAARPLRDDSFGGQIGDEIVYSFAFGNPANPMTPFSEPQMLRLEFALDVRNEIVRFNTGGTQQRRRVTIPSQPFPSDTDLALAEVHFAENYGLEQVEPFVFEFASNTPLPAKDTWIRYDVRSAGVPILSDQSLYVDTYEVVEFPSSLTLAVRGTGTELDLLEVSSLYGPSNTPVPLQIVLKNLPPGFYIQDTGSNQLTLFLESARLSDYSLKMTEVYAVEPLAPVSALDGYYVMAGGISSLRAGTLVDERVFPQNRSEYRNEASVEDVQLPHDRIVPFTGAPLLPLPVPDPDPEEMTLTLDQAGQLQFVVPPSIRGTHPRALQFYVKTPPTKGAICRRSDGQPMTSWFETSDVIYQHQGASTAADFLELYVVSGNFTPTNRMRTLRLFLQVQPLPSVQLEQNTAFLDALPTTVPIQPFLSPITALPPGVSFASGAFLVSSLESFVSGAVPIPLSVSPSNALILERPGIYTDALTLPYEIRVNTVYIRNQLLAAPGPRVIAYSFLSGEIFRDFSATISFQVLFDTAIGVTSSVPDAFKYDVFDFSLALRMFNASGDPIYNFEFIKEESPLYRFDVYQRIQVEFSEGAAPRFSINERDIPSSRQPITGMSGIRRIELWSDPPVFTKNGVWDGTDTDIPISYELSNAVVGTRLQNFNLLLSPEDTLEDTGTINIAIGQGINIQGNNNICIGKNFLTSGNNSIIVGNEIGVDDTNSESDVNSIYESILIGSSSFRNTVVRNVIGIGNNNLNNMFATLTNDQVSTFFSKEPIVIGNNIPSSFHEFFVNVGNTFLKGDAGIYLGSLGDPVRIGFSNVASNLRPEAQLFVQGGTIEAPAGVASPVSLMTCVLSGAGSVGDVVRALDVGVVQRCTQYEDPAVVGVLHQQLGPELWYVATRGLMRLRVPADAVVGSLLVSNVGGTIGLAVGNVLLSDPEGLIQLGSGAAKIAATFGKVCGPRDPTTQTALCMLSV